MMKKWYTLYREEYSGTEWKQRIWLFDLLSRHQKNELLKQGWQLSGKPIPEEEEKPRNRNGVKTQQKGAR